MKRLIFLALILVSVPVAYAASTMEFVVNSATQYATTKGNMTVPTVPTAPILVTTPSSGCTMSINTYSATNNLPLAANTHYKFQTPSEVTNLVFRCTSSAANYIHVVK